ncbi:hypothetical protein HK103_002787 [Boothiomyces macroporosus]|uniref:PXA domain-containing protein n=1 Tax=Boothiomyces macroporosus TaxID=261099 RepID=A0AAD5UMQ1_9FUNG|nr:hypothetical protein HK103_002760 [Boothiomyces macroporosus]KAJ3262372.1 hypothetical protein HK103_002787 [Boothiomyces macroporosus]
MPSNLKDILQLVKQQKMTSSEKVNSELSRIIALLLHDYVSAWYSLLSDDMEFYKEIVQTISVLIQEIERRLSRVDWIELISFDLPKVLTNHIKDYKNCCSKLGTAYSGGKSFEELFYGIQPHTALSSNESELEYMQKVSDILLDILLPESELLEPEFLETAYYEGYKSEQSDFESDILSQTSESPEAYLPSEQSSELNLSTKSTEEPTLFKVKQKSGFLRLKRRKSDPNNPNNAVQAITSGLNKFTFGGFDKISNKMDKFKDFVSQESGIERRRRRVKSTSEKNESNLKRNDSESEAELYEASTPDTSPSKAPQLVITKSNSDLSQLTSNHMYSEQSRLDSHLAPPGMLKMKPMVSFSELKSEESVELTVPTQSDVYGVLKNVWDQLWKLHWETKKGPWKLGPINTTLYDRHHLEESFLELVHAILELDKDQYWSIMHIQFFIRPVTATFFGHIINREDTLALYLELIRESFWPNDIPCAPNPLRSESEKKAIRERLENNLHDMIPKNYNYLMKPEDTKEKVKSLVDVFQNKRINKHLLYIAVDLILVHIAPEIASPKVNF